MLSIGAASSRNSALSSCLIKQIILLPSVVLRLLLPGSNESAEETRYGEGIQVMAQRTAQQISCYSTPEGSHCDPLNQAALCHMDQTLGEINFT